MIEEFGFGMISVDGYAYAKDLIILPERVVEDWRREKGHLVQLKDLEQHIKDVSLDVLVVGTGKFGFLKINHDVHLYAHENKIELFYDTSDNAVDKYNSCVQSGRTVVGAFHLTC